MQIIFFLSSQYRAEKWFVSIIIHKLPDFISFILDLFQKTRTHAHSYIHIYMFPLHLLINIYDREGKNVLRCYIIAIQVISAGESTPPRYSCWIQSIISCISILHMGYRRRSRQSPPVHGGDKMTAT